MKTLIRRKKNSTVETLQNELDCHEIDEESNSSDNGKNMKDDEEDWRLSRENYRLGHQINGDKSLFSITESTRERNLQKCFTLKKTRSAKSKRNEKWNKKNNWK